MCGSEVHMLQVFPVKGGVSNNRLRCRNPELASQAFAHHSSYKVGLKGLLIATIDIRTT